MKGHSRGQPIDSRKTPWSLITLSSGWSCNRIQLWLRCITLAEMRSNVRRHTSSTSSWSRSTSTRIHSKQVTLITSSESTTTNRRSHIRQSHASLKPSQSGRKFLPKVHKKNLLCTHPVLIAFWTLVSCISNVATQQTAKMPFCNVFT